MKKHFRELVYLGIYKSMDGKLESQICGTEVWGWGRLMETGAQPALYTNLKE